MLFASLLFVACDNRKVDPGADRTVLLYAAESNLGVFIQRNLDDMLAAIAADHSFRGNLVTFISDGSDNTDLLCYSKNADGIGCSTIASVCGSAVDPKTLQNVILLTAQYCRSESYGAVFSSHGTGWLPQNVKSMQRSWGEENGSRMDIADMAAAIPDDFFEFVIFDACCMGAVECAFEFKDKCRYFIASPSEILVDGFPFRTITPMLYAGTIDYDAVARAYYTHYMRTEPFADIVVVKSANMPQLANAVRLLLGSDVDNALFSLDTAGVQILADMEVAPVPLFDMADAMQRLNSFPSDSVMLDNYIRSAVVAAYHTGAHYCDRTTRAGIEMPINTYCGLSMYIMRSRLSDLNSWYRSLKWYKAISR